MLCYIISYIFLVCQVDFYAVYPPISIAGLSEKVGSLADISLKNTKKAAEPCHIIMISQPPQRRLSIINILLIYHL